MYNGAAVFTLLVCVIGLRNALENREAPLCLAMMIMPGGLWLHEWINPLMESYLYWDTVKGRMWELVRSQSVGCVPEGYIPCWFPSICSLSLLHVC